MKKLFLILSLITVITTVQAQSQLKTVRGKTKEGKSIVVRYSQGSFEDNIESVKYEVVDELQNKVKEQQNKVTNLQNKLEASERTVQQLQQQIKANNGDNKAFAAQMAKKNEEIDSLNLQINSLGIQINLLNRQIDSLNNQINLQGIHSNSLDLQADSLNHQIISLNSRIGSLESECMQLRQENKRLKNRRKPNDTISKSLINSETHIVGVELRIGQVIYGHTVNEGWNHDTRFSKHVAVYYGSPNLTKSVKFPVSIEAGVGASYFGMSANRSAYGFVLDGQSDIDNDIYQAQYYFGDLDERLSMAYLDIPVRVCIGQPNKNHASVYAKVGLTPSILIHSSFSGNGTYSLKGFYEDLQITLEDIPELGFVSNANCYNEEGKPEMSRFMLWGNVAVGAYVPFGTLPIQLNFGVKVDYPITSIGKATSIEAIPEGMGLLSKGNKVIVPSAVIGIVYTIK